MSQLDKNIRAAQAKNMTKGVAVLLLGALLVFLYFAWLILTKGHSLAVSPAEAEMTAFVSMRDGMGITIGGSVYRFGGDVTVVVDANKFEPEVITITSSSPATIPILLKPSPGIIDATTTPADESTMWIINDEPIFIGSEFNHSIEPDEYTLEIEHKYYEPVVQKISVVSDETISINLPLNQIDGVILIKSTPAKAEVFIDNESLGQTPVTLNKVGGAYDVKLKLNGYDDIEDSIEVSVSDRNPQRHYKMEPKQGFVHITTNTSGGTLLIDGKLKQEGLISVYANQKHSVIYEKDGYYPFATTVSVNPSETKNIAIKLKQEFGKVILNSSPSATIYIDGKAVGEATVETKLPAVTHTIEFKLAGYRAVKQTIMPTSKRTNKINVQLLTEFEARKKEGIPLYSETIGIKMNKYSMSSFTMGSPVNEIDRRRNEHQIPVRFNRPVWLARHEITEAQFQKFKSSISSSSYPVTDITWNEAALFCNWLSQKDGLPIFYVVRANRVVSHNTSSNGYRLPTEAEWEWLAKQYKRVTPTKFIWGDTDKLPKNSANIADSSLTGQQVFVFKDQNDGFAGKAPVGSFKINKSGVYDLVGNVSEWVHDLYSFRTPPSDKPQLNYMGASNGTSHIYKGGNYKTGKISELRASYKETSEKAEPTIGFRIARYN